MTKSWSVIAKIGAAAILSLSAIGISAKLTAPRAEAVPGPTAPSVRLPGARTLEPIQPIDGVAPLDALARSRVRLGARLFAEPRLSGDDSLACAGCHDLAHGGADGRPLPVGVKGRVGAVNTPSVFNVDMNVKQFWDGRADSLESQLDGPLLDPNEMASSWEDILRKLRSDPTYKAEFDSAYAPLGVTSGNVRDAIARFERTLVTPSSRFDRFLAGERDAITDDERLGYERFKSYGCISCHQGRNVGGNLFEKLGIMEDYFAERGGPLTTADLGRFNVTKREEDRFMFRVPSLRMVALTAPYFHDGHAATLEAAIVLMGRYQLGQQIPPEEVRTIAAFLRTLAGAYVPEDIHATR